MDLTPKKRTPWWNLLRCCRPSAPDDGNDSKDSVAKSEAKGACSGSNVSQNVEITWKFTRRKSSELNSIQEGDDETASASSIHFLDEDLPLEIGEETEMAAAREVDRDEMPIMDEPVISDKDGADKSIAFTGSAKSSSPEMAFWQFLFLMMLRNTLGLDYVSSKMKVVDS
jgi:hypothetical protein